ncbi:hypothetical protein EVAR_48701_1 [Eumeta japonica]|uniref:Uncharacterized protein n=1 Tax=Eumeta variegata TaxID=151549 RepID=A0A4C1XF63_EUMVA|nr:hypothetical protein EVAR_48701_1 [Eumeta japonica]
MRVPLFHRVYGTIKTVRHNSECELAPAEFQASVLTNEMNGGKQGKSNENGKIEITIIEIRSRCRISKSHVGRARPRVKRRRRRRHSRVQRRTYPAAVCEAPACGRCLRARMYSKPRRSGSIIKLNFITLELTHIVGVKFYLLTIQLPPAAPPACT